MQYRLQYDRRQRYEQQPDVQHCHYNYDAYQRHGLRNRPERRRQVIQIIIPLRHHANELDAILKGCIVELFEVYVKTFPIYLIVQAVDEFNHLVLPHFAQQSPHRHYNKDAAEQQSHVEYDPQKIPSVHNAVHNQPRKDDVWKRICRVYNDIRYHNKKKSLVIFPYLMERKEQIPQLDVLHLCPASPFCPSRFNATYMS